uniref:Ladderlectin n=1 Tax=Oreochromis niloticus TaxID=8128 RepID=A0A669DUH4_ORENI
MKLLLVSVLLCAVMVLTPAACEYCCKGCKYMSFCTSLHNKSPFNVLNCLVLTDKVDSSGAGDLIPTGISDQVNMSSCCPHGWTRFNRRCFVYIPTAMNWAHAERKCRSMGAHLASVHSSSEYHLIQKLTGPYGYKTTWIGGTNASGKHVWSWTDGSCFSYTHWCPGEPNNACGNQHCLQINYSGSKCWDDLQCDSRLPSICARKISRHLG